MRANRVSRWARIDLGTLSGAARGESFMRVNRGIGGSKTRPRPGFRAKFDRVGKRPGLAGATAPEDSGAGAEPARVGGASPGWGGGDAVGSVDPVEGLRPAYKPRVSINARISLEFPYRPIPVGRVKI